MRNILSVILYCNKDKQDISKDKSSMETTAEAKAENSFMHRMISEVNIVI